MSAHFAVLREANLVDATRRGTTITYQLKLSVLEDALLGFAETFGIEAKPARRRALGRRVVEKEAPWEPVFFGGLARRRRGRSWRWPYCSGSPPGDREWAPAIVKGWWMVFGLAMAAWGNYLPKLVAPWPAGEGPFDWPRVHRFAGWVTTAGGTASVLVWLTLPPAEAAYLSVRILPSAGAVVLVRKLGSLATHQPPIPSP